MQAHKEGVSMDLQITDKLRDNWEHGALVKLMEKYENDKTECENAFNAYRKYAGYMNEAVTALHLLQFFCDDVINRLKAGKITEITEIHSYVYGSIYSITDTFNDYKILNEVFISLINECLGVVYYNNAILTSDDLIEGAGIFVDKNYKYYLESKVLYGVIADGMEGGLLDVSLYSYIKRRIHVKLNAIRIDFGYLVDSIWHDTVYTWSFLSGHDKTDCILMSSDGMSYYAVDKSTNTDFYKSSGHGWFNLICYGCLLISKIIDGRQESRYLHKISEKEYKELADTGIMFSIDTINGFISHYKY